MGTLFATTVASANGHFIGVVRVLDRACSRAGLEGVTPHVLRHTFASVAGDLGFSELTIAGLLGHSARGVTQGYIHLDTALVTAAEKVSLEIASLLDGTGSRQRRGRKGELRDPIGDLRSDWHRIAPDRQSRNGARPSEQFTSSG